MSGLVFGSTVPPTPLTGENVSLLGTSCVSLEEPASCPLVAFTLTNSTGNYRLPAPPGSYYVYAHRSTRWGGGWAAVTLNGTNVARNLRVYPFVPYGNATFVLPAWNNLSGFASNCNAQGPCGSGVYGTQVPLLSWTQDGAYYVNASTELVYFDFPTRTVHPVAPWEPLYDDLMYYQGIENTDWITADGTYVYEFGCPSDCGPGNPAVPVEFYAVNLTTHRTFSHTFSGVSPASTDTNGEVQLIGENGNSSVAVVITSDGVVHGYNLWNGTEWTLGTLPYFEANNIYWVPTLNSFIDVEAMGSSQDRIAQLEVEGPSPGVRLTSVFLGTYASGFVSNGVDGLYVNTTSRQLIVSEATGGAPLRTEAFSIDHQSRLNGTYTTL
ncbi:MAG TPA: hypothetical protein VGS23_02745, partial [Thermoplasmata archaeon]|nr:hypothetical protein [Thermoplasmata archaeon]